MAELKASFIPKKPIQKIVKTKRRPLGFLFVVSFIVLLGAVGVAGGLYFYKLFLEGQVVLIADSIEKAKQAIDPSLIAKLEEFDARLKSVDIIINQHIALTPLFELLEDLTLQTVRFNNFNYTINQNGKITIIMNGEAKSFASIALQSDIFGQEPDIKSPIFSNLQPNIDGNVNFNFTALVDRNLVLYKNNLGDLPRFEISINSGIRNEEFNENVDDIEFIEGI